MINLTAIGHLGKDAIVNDVNGKKVINFNIAHTEKYKDNNGAATEKTIWIQCSYWSEKTGIAPYLKKGTQVYISGQPEVKEFKKNDGSYGSSLNCRVSVINLLGSKPDGQPSGASQQQSSPKQNTTDANAITEPLDDLPF